MQPLKNSLLALLLMHSTLCVAENADRDKPVNLEADQVMIDDARQTSTFTGNVRLSQGTLLIKGEKIVVTQDPKGYTVSTAYGHTAEFRQKREGLEEYVEGYGERIIYDTRAENIDMLGQARIKRQLDDLRGEHITYNAKTETFRVNSGASAPQGSPPQRVRAVLHPKTQPSPASAVAPAQTNSKPGKNPTSTE